MFRTQLLTAALSAALFLAALAAAVHAGAPATDAKTEAEFISLFDGTSLQGWTDTNGKPPSSGWVVEDGVIHRNALKAGNIITERQFDNFDLRFEWKVNKGGNSGLKYRTFPVPKKGLYGCEYQIIDDDNHPNGTKATTRCGALYDLYAPDEGQKVVKPVGEYNASRVVAQGTRIEHWLNGKKILEVDTASDEWKDRIAKSKFKSFKEFAAEKPGPILLQDHNNEIWFRKIAIRPLPARSAAE
jgi:Domain of Unknown Function (DUF1080)